YCAGASCLASPPAGAGALPAGSLSSSLKSGAESRSAIAEGGGLSIGCFLYSQADSVTATRTMARSEYFIIQSSYRVQNDSLTEAFEDSNPLAPVLFSLEQKYNRIWIWAIEKAVPRDGLF